MHNIVEFSEVLKKKMQKHDDLIKQNQNLAPNNSPCFKEPPPGFEAIARKNEAISERLKRQREQANKDVLKNYKIK